MYKCYDCGAVFEQPIIKEWDESRGEFWGMPCCEHMVEWHCPCCDSDDIDEYNEEDEEDEDI